MSQPPLRPVAEALIRSIRLKKPGAFWRFIPSRPGSSFGGNIGIELFIDHKALRRTAVLTIRSAAKRLDGMPLGEVSSLLTRSLQDGFWRYMDRVLPELGKDRVSTLWELSNSDDVDAVANMIEAALSSIAVPKLWLVPGWRLAVDGQLDREHWLIARGGAQPNTLGAVIQSPGVDGSLFPPVAMKIRTHAVGDRDSWLGVRARDSNQSHSRLAALFGAISLAIEFPRSRVFSGAEFPDGLFSLDAIHAGFSTHGPQFPPIMDGASLSADNLDWIGRLLHNPSRNTELQLRILTCLEYVAAGWQPTGRLGFVHNAIAFDALFGVEGQVTKSIVGGVSANAPGITQIDQRIRALLKMRHALLHGSAPALEVTTNYIDYWDRYDADPHQDQVMILRTCIHSLNS